MSKSYKILSVVIVISVLFLTFNIYQYLSNKDKNKPNTMQRASSVSIKNNLSLSQPTEEKSKTQNIKKSPPICTEETTSSEKEVRVDNNTELPEMDIELPKVTGSVQIIDSKRPSDPRELIELPATKIDSKGRAIVEQFFTDLDENMKNIESIELDYKETHSDAPQYNMSGHITSNKVDSFVFDGTFLDNTLHGRILYEDHKTIVLGEEEKTPGVDLTVVSDIIWSTQLRHKGTMELFEKVKLNQTIESLAGKQVICTELSGPIVSAFFETSTGRLMEIRVNHPKQHTTRKFEYNEKYNYPQKMITYLHDTDETCTYEMNNLKLTYKE